MHLHRWGPWTLDRSEWWRTGIWLDLREVHTCLTCGRTKARRVRDFRRYIPKGMRIER